MGSLEVEFFDGTRVELGPEETLIIEELPFELGRDTVSATIENGAYWGRMYVVDEGEILPTRNQQVLFMPQLASDKIPPLAQFPSEFTLSFDGTKEFQITDYLQEDARIVESDIRGIAPSSIQKNSELSYTFGPFDDIIPKELTIELTDENGNVSRFDMTLKPSSP